MVRWNRVCAWVWLDMSLCLYVLSILTARWTVDLVQAMSLMSDEEQLSLEADARRIQTNVRSWLLRRNYRSMRDAARKLQAATRGMLARKNFEVHKHKAFAALVIQRATRSWLKSFVDASVGAAGAAVAPVRRPSLHTVPEDRRE